MSADADRARTERRRIEAVYAEYDADPAYDERRELGRPGNEWNERDRWRDAAAVLEATGRTGLRGARVVEVGAGIGANLDALVALGADRRAFVGIDLLGNRLAVLRDRGVAGAVQGDGTALPVATASVDVVVLSTVISSILDPRVQEAVAVEAVRLLRGAGTVLWYDLRVGNPRNRAVRGVDRKRLQALFPGFRIEARASTVLPPLARRLPAWARPAWAVLRLMRPLRSHWTAALVRYEP